MHACVVSVYRALSLSKKIESLGTRLEVVVPDYPTNPLQWNLTNLHPKLMIFIAILMFVPPFKVYIISLVH